ncbi:MAG: ABC transporter permease [Jatrophihabitans sp.]
MPADPVVQDCDDAAVASGLDALEQVCTRNRRIDWVAVLAPIGAVLLLIGIWELVVLAKVKPNYVLPGPADVWHTLRQEFDNGDAVEAMWTSLRRGVLGFLIALVLGTVIGVVVGQISLLRKAFRPLLSAMQSLPSVAWVPAAVVWFHLSNATIYAVILLGAVPSIAMGLIGGLDQTPPMLARVGRVLGASRLQQIRYVLLPAALPTYVSGLKQGWAFSWRSLMAAELIVLSPRLGLGLGHLLNEGRDLSDMSLVITSIVLVLMVGIAVDLMVFAPLERRVLRNRGLTGAGL